MSRTLLHCLLKEVADSAATDCLFLHQLIRNQFDGQCIRFITKQMFSSGQQTLPKTLMLCLAADTTAQQPTNHAKILCRACLAIVASKTGLGNHPSKQDHDVIVQ
jgi:hypothetical protein